MLESFAKRWVAHDGVWFQSVENDHGIEDAIVHDIDAMSKFTVIEAKRIMEFLELPEEGGLDALGRALEIAACNLPVNAKKRLIFHVNL